MADEAWTRLAGAVRTRRDALGWTQAELAARSGVSEPTIRVIETARRTSFQRATLRAIAQALGWTADSGDRIIRGEEPQEAGHVADGPMGSDDAALDRLTTLERRLDEYERREAEREAEVWKVVHELQARWDRVQALLEAESRNPSPTQAFDADSIRERMESEQDQEWQERLAAVTQRPAAPGEDGAEKAG